MAGDCQAVESLEETKLDDALPFVAGTLSCVWATRINTECYKSYQCPLSYSDWSASLQGAGIEEKGS